MQDQKVVYTYREKNTKDQESKRLQISQHQKLEWKNYLPLRLISKTINEGHRQIFSDIHSYKNFTLHVLPQEICYMSKSESKKRKTWHIKNRALTQKRSKQNLQDARKGKSWMTSKHQEQESIIYVTLSNNLKLPPTILTYTMAFTFLQRERAHILLSFI